MGVICLLGYIAGALVVVLGSSHLMMDLSAGDDLRSSAGLVGGGVVLVVVSAVLHALVVRRRGHGGVLDDSGAWLSSGAWTGLALWAVPTLWAWLQFEWFMEPVQMYPLPTVAGGVLLAYAVGWRLAHRSPAAQPLAMVGVALVGLPMGLLAVALPAGHFRHHLTEVSLNVMMPGSAQRQQYALPAEDPLHVAPLPGLGAGTLAYLEALASAQAVDVDAEVAAGRMRQRPDGTWVAIDADGAEQPLGTAADLAALGQAAERADAQAAALAHAAAEQARQARQARQAGLRERRLGGRLWGRPPTP